MVGVKDIMRRERRWRKGEWCERRVVRKTSVDGEGG